MKKIILILLPSILIITGCAKENNTSNELESISERVEKLEQSIEDSNIRADNMEDKINKDEQNELNKVNLESFKIYGYDETMTTRGVQQIVNIPENYSKEEKINILFNKIRYTYFTKLNLEIKIREDNILELNIVDGGEYNSSISSSAQIDEFYANYIYTLLQTDYKGDWIDGVQVLSGGIVRNDLAEGAFQTPYMRLEQ